MSTRIRALCLLALASVLATQPLFAREWLQKPVNNIKPSQLSSNGDTPSVGDCVQISGTNTNYFAFGNCVTGSGGGDMTKAVYDTDSDNIVDNSENVGTLSTTGLVKRLGASNFTTITDNSANWNIAYAYGNHAAIGYLTTELDPVFSASNASLITLTNINQWNDAYAFGNWQGQGFLTVEVDGSTTNELQNLFGSVSADTGAVTAGSTNTALTIQGAGTVSTAISGNTLTITGVPGSGSNLFGIISSDSGNVAASGTNTTLNVVGAGTVSTAISGNTLTVTGAAGAGSNLFGVINTNLGSVTATSTNTTLTLVGNDITNVTAAGNVITITVTEADPIYSGDPAFGITAQDIANWNIAYAYGNWQSQGFLTTESDPIFSASNAASITATNMDQWNQAYAYGNHAAVGYLTTEVDGSTTNELQNIFGVIQTNSGSITAASTNTTFSIVGDEITGVTATGNTVFINVTEVDPTVDTSAEIQAIIGASVYLPSGDVALGSGTSGNYVSGATVTGGLTMTGTEGATLGITPCSNENYIQKWNAATGWTCQADSGAGGGYTNLTEFVDQTAWQLFYSNANGDITELPVGAVNTALIGNGATSAPSFDKLQVGGMNWASVPQTVATFVVDGGGSAFTTGFKISVTVPYAATLTGWDLILNALDTVKVDVWLDALANTPLADANSITNSSEPQTSSAIYATAATTNWSDVTIDAGQEIGISVDTAPVGNCTKMTLVLKGYRT